MGEFVRLEVEDGVGTIRLDRPPMNAIDEALTEELFDVAVEAGKRQDVGAVVIYGGEKLFAAGADVKMMVEMDPIQVRPMITRLQEVFTVVEDIPKVTIAAVTGFALGGGCELAMCADFRYAAESAKLGQPEIALGIIPGAGGTQRLPRLVGPARAKDLIYSGRFVEAAEALAIGLVDKVVPAADVYSTAVEMVRPYVTGPTQALRAAKLAVDRGLDMNLDSGRAWETQLFASLFATSDAREGMTAFVAKRKPTFTGE